MAANSHTEAAHVVKMAPLPLLDCTGCGHRFCPCSFDVEMSNSLKIT